ncbi:major_cap_HK97, phage major capsid protein, HK97 family [uncultured Caudovirales phage]|uniref:Major_cap_HK97, phage major capsid protein, HK97 family n=1 Tax=uncultured Caudovirales phage TaxID=2100421 RepID=A0A6J5P1N5_9CAUD|nr:major_cap_HK97, phage major capsid protein, HK97 family [uncultured Caudovirales phage]
MKTITEKILDGIKQTLEAGDKITIDLREAASLGGSGDGQGGRTYFDNAFAALRYANPFRRGARQIKVAGSSAQFVAKTGNAANQTNPWGYTFTPNTGTPGTNTTIWQLPTRVITAQLPIRTAAMSDINYLNETIVQDLMLEFSAIEAASMADNNDQSGSTTTTMGATDGLRGLNYYPGASGATAAYGSSGTAITNGRHTLATVGHSRTAVDYETLADMANALPPQYWGLPGTAWHMHPSYISAIRQYAHGSGGYSLVETGEMGEGPAVNILGFPVIPNPYLDPTGTAGNFPVYLANWPLFMTIADVEEMTIQAMEETTPGFITLYAEKRMVSTVRDPFAGVRLIET